LIALYTDDPELKREQLMSAARELGLPEIAVASARDFARTSCPFWRTEKRDYVSIQKLAGSW